VKKPHLDSCLDNPTERKNHARKGCKDAVPVTYNVIENGFLSYKSYSSLLLGIFYAGEKEGKQTDI